MFAKKWFLLGICGVFVLMICSNTFGGWYDGDYMHKSNITNLSTTSNGLAINGTEGFSSKIIWINPVGSCGSAGTPNLYYNSSTVYTAVCNDTTSIPFETEGAGLNYTPTSVWDARSILHLAEQENYTILSGDSYLYSYKLYNQFANSGTLVNNTGFGSSLIWTNPYGCDSSIGSDLKFNSTTVYNVTCNGTSAPFETDPSGRNSTPTTIWGSNAVAIYHLSTNGSVLDSTANALNGQKGVGTTFTTSGKYGNAYVFHGVGGVNDIINISDNDKFTSQSFTITAWINTKSGYTNEGRIFSKLDYANDEWTMRMELDPYRRVSCFIRNTSTGSYLAIYGSATNLTLNTWYFIACTFDNTTTTNNFNIYKNGVLDSSATNYPYSISNTAAPVTIGAFWPGGLGIGVFNGTIDEVRYYNKTLTAGEIFSIYAGNSLSYNVTDSTGLTSPKSIGAIRGTGLYGNGYVCDGADDYFKLNKTGLSFSANEAFAVSLWAKTSEQYGMIYSQRSLVSGSPVLDIAAGYNGVTSTAGNLSVIYRDDVGANYGVKQGAYINDSIWHHIVLTRYTNGTAELYLDGASQGLLVNSTGGTANQSGAITTDLNSLCSERRWVNAANVLYTQDRLFFNGTIDEVRIYNRSLSATEIAEMYNNYDKTGNGALLLNGQENFSSCIYYGSGNWNINCFDNCSITSNVDIGGNNITITGQGTFTTTANITNYLNLLTQGIDSANRCTVTSSNGGRFWK